MLGSGYPVLLVLTFTMQTCRVVSLQLRLIYTDVNV